jgi:TonB family protein
MARGPPPRVAPLRSANLGHPGGVADLADSFGAAPAAGGGPSIEEESLRSTEIESESNNQIAPSSSQPAPPGLPAPGRRRTLIVDDSDAEFVPHLLAQLEDDLARSRKREAFWISIIIHILAILAVIYSPQWLPNWAQPHILRAEDLAKQPTFLALPSDLQKPPEKVKSDKLSDKNRIAQTPHPIDRKTLDELREQRMRGNMMPPSPPEAQPAPPQTQQGAGSQSAANNFPQQRVQPQGEGAMENPFRTPSSAGDLIAQAARNARRMGTGGGGGYGGGPMDRNASLGPFDILSDTQGVDFGPYLSRALQSIKANWYNLIPEEARAPLLKHGKVTIRFLITPNGKVTGMYIETPSGDIPLDRAAYGGITASDPFSPLPRDFHGPYLALRIRFYYNPRTGEIEQDE